ncbi:ATP-dependent Clp protease ATP-binding subunit [Candidatus Margulisiibacteriota bacterium]
MFSRFTEKAIQSIMLAQEEAKKFNHGYVGTEHILLGILGEGENVVIKTLQELGFSPEQLKVEIEQRLEYGNASTSYGTIPFTQQAKQILAYAWDEARQLGHNYVNVEHLFLAIFRDPTSVAARVITEIGVNLTTFKETVFKLLGNKVAPAAQKAQSTVPTPTLDMFGRDLTWLASDNKLDPVIGREKEIQRMIQIICRRTKNNPVLTGAPGVGKTAIVEGLAQRIVDKKVPEKLLTKRLISLDLGLLIAGTKYRGEFEDRVKKIMEEVRKAKDVILFVDELHTIIGTGGSEGSLDAANLFKPALSRGELQCVGATTLDEYRKHIEGDGALERRFQSVFVEEPTFEETIQILEGIKEAYEKFHQVTFTEDALFAAVDLSIRYITDRNLPDKAVDLIDEAASKVMLKSSDIQHEISVQEKELEKIEMELKGAKTRKEPKEETSLEKKQKKIKREIENLKKHHGVPLQREVTDAHIAEIVAGWTHVPVTKLTQAESEKLLEMENELETKVVGQNEAIKALVRAVKRSKVGLKDDRRPAGSFMFLGPTGVGKSELAKTLAEYLFGSKEAVVRLDMSEYMEKHTVSRMIGSPPGYVGYNEGGQLTEPVRRKPYSVILFDELEKASPDVINILLQILDDGRLTDATGRMVNFKNTIIIMTSNIGSRYIQKETTFGFVDTTHMEKQKYEGMKNKLRDELKREFRPEFLNRIDDVIIFKSLTKEDLLLIANIMLNEIEARLKKQDIHFDIDDKCKKLLVDKGFDQKNGARPLRRSIQEHFEDKLADVLLLEKHRTHIMVKATTKKNEVSFTISPLKQDQDSPKAKQKQKAKPKVHLVSSG